MARHSWLILLVCSAPLRAQQSAARIPTSLDTVVLGLPALVTAALRANIDLRAADVESRLALSDLMAARGAFDPSFTVGTQRGTRSADVVAGARTTQTAFTTTASMVGTLPVGSQIGLTANSGTATLDPFLLSSASPFPKSHTSGLGLSFTQPLLRGFGREGAYGDVDAAAKSVEASRKRFERQIDLTVALVERAYWRLRQAEAIETVTRQSLEAARAIYDRNVALRARDLATTLDVLTAERGAATRETQLLDAVRQRVDAAERLLFLAYGEDATAASTPDAARVRTAADSLRLPVVPDVASVEREAIVTRADAVAAAREFEGSMRLASKARNGRLPRLDLIGSAAYGGASPTSRLFTFGDSSDIRNTSWTLGFSTSLFQRNDAARAASDRAIATVSIARYAVAAVENDVRAEVRAAVRAVQTARDRYVRAGDIVRLADQEYNAAREGSRLGLVSTFQLLQYEGELVQARLLQAQARFALEDAGTQLRVARGVASRFYGVAPPE